MTTDRSPPSARWLGARLGVLALVVVALGPPLTSPREAAALGLAALLAATGELRRGGRWIALALGCALAVVGARALLDLPRIEEGHNVFVTYGKRDPFMDAFPPEVYATVRSEFHAIYPREKSCTPRTPGCWSQWDRRPKQAYAFSADGIWQRPEWSRVVHDIRFRDRESFRGGFVNQDPYNWREHSDIQRERMPYVVVYRLPGELVDSALCWRGLVLWEEADGSFTEHRTKGRAKECREIVEGDVGHRVFGVAVAKRKRPLQLWLRASPWVERTLAWERGLSLAGAAAVLLALVRVRPLRALAPVAVAGVAAGLVRARWPDLLDGFAIQGGGTDGRTHQAFGYEVVRQLVGGHLGAALRGGEDVFFYMPGPRYLRAIEKLLFGDTDLGWVAMLLALPLALLAVGRRIGGPLAGLALAALFLGTELGRPFGLDLATHAELTRLGFAAPAAQVGILAAVALFLARFDGRAAELRRMGWLGGALAFSVVMRPNLLPAAAVLGAFATLEALGRDDRRAVRWLVLGFAPVALVPLHNVVFGGEAVAFTSGATHPVNLTAPPSLYLAALAEMAGFAVDGAPAARIGEQLREWAGGARVLAFLALVALPLVARHLERRTLGVAAAAFAQHVVLWFWHPGGQFGRYQLVAWCLTLIALLLALRDGLAGTTAHRRATASGPLV